MVGSRIDELLADYQHFHSTLQMQAFITGRAGLGKPWGMYLQALRELKKRRDDLQQMDINQRRLALQIAELDGTKRPWFRSFWRLLAGELYRQREQLKLEELRNAMKEARLVRSDVQREFNEFYDQADKLKTELGPLTPEIRHQLDCEQWAHNLRASALLELLATDSMSTNTLEFLAAAPAELREKVLQDLKALGLPKGRVASDVRGIPCIR
jgi:hypothetical protein